MLPSFFQNEISCSFESGLVDHEYIYGRSCIVVLSDVISIVTIIYQMDICLLRFWVVRLLLSSVPSGLIFSKGENLLAG